MSDINEEFFYIEKFQLENLINNSCSFLFFNLSSDLQKKNLSEYALNILKLSQEKTEAEVKKAVKSQEKSTPVILICERGLKSHALAQDLQKKGFINAFFLKDGIKALIEHIE